MNARDNSVKDRLKKKGEKKSGMHSSDSIITNMVSTWEPQMKEFIRQEREAQAKIVEANEKQTSLLHQQVQLLAKMKKKNDSISDCMNSLASTQATFAHILAQTLQKDGS